MVRTILLYVLGIIVLGIHSKNTCAQYFGQNKPSYENFNFQLYKTPHFDIYHYLKSDSLISKLAKLSETWYHHHQQILLDTFNVENPMLIYSNHADFQQTNAIHGLISIGTGGVTEGFKKRIVFPLSYSSYQTYHVIGHEMVHAFQYDLLNKYTLSGLATVQNIPLWMIEGMAEYLSIGNYDSQTVLWMRDALIHKNFPTLMEMTYNLKYSPYRFGHAFWSYISNTYGEQYIRKLFLETAEKGVDRAVSDMFYISLDSLSVNFKNALNDQLLKNVNDSVLTVYGDKFITKKNGGSYNLSPSVSPDGKHIIFLSEKDLFSLDLFLADTKSGDTICKLYSSTHHDAIDAINFVETAGTWSPDSRYFAYVAFIKGESALIIFDIKKQKIINEVFLKEMDAISFPAWSPTNKNKIAYTGIKDGQTDLYLYDLNEKTYEKLTSDAFSNFQAKWQPDGKGLFYVTDESCSEQKLTTDKQCNIAYLDLATKTHKVFTTFDGAENLNPLINKNGSEFYFLSDRDGTRNIYCYQLTTDQILQLTFYPTGVTGLTNLSPAMDLSGNSLYYNILNNGEFSIIKTNTEKIKGLSKIVDKTSLDLSSTRITSYSHFLSSVDENIIDNRLAYKASIDSFYTGTIQSKFKLDYIGNTAVGVVASRFGSGFAGSVQTRFSDILGEHVLYSGISINGKIYDFGGLAAYVNQKTRLKKGISISHIPYQTGYYSYDEDGNISYFFRRIFVDKVSLFGYYPINKTHRFELGISGANYSFRTEKIDDYNYYYSYLSQESKVVESPDPFRAFIVDAAWVMDNSTFGLTAPIEGKRLRIGYERYFSDANLNNILIDFRKYFFWKPYSLAFRIYHHGRYGKKNDATYDMYIGYPWYIRGYEGGSIYGNEEDGKISIQQLTGSKIIVSNLEFRIPFSGPGKYAMIKSRSFFSDLALFYDGGIAWDSDSDPSWEFSTSTIEKRIPIMSTGLALRINLFGAFIIEPYYAFPIHQGIVHNGNFGLNLLAGW